MLLCGELGTESDGVMKRLRLARGTPGVVNQTTGSPLHTLIAIRTEMKADVSSARCFCVFGFFTDDDKVKSVSLITPAHLYKKARSTYLDVVPKQCCSSSKSLLALYLSIELRITDILISHSK